MVVYRKQPDCRCVMPGKMAMVDYNRCHPEECEDGICLAAGACERNLLKQEKAYEAPMPDPSICRACGDCVRACPLGALEIIKI